MTKLTSKAVHNIMTKVLFTDAEVAEQNPPERAVIISGLVRTFGFNPDRLKECKSEIDALLLQLPDTFRKDVGGGWSFLNGCIDRDEQQWGEQRDVEELVCLGIAVGSASWLMKEYAPIMPGGVPYFMVDVKQPEAESNKFDITEQVVCDPTNTVYEQ